MRVAFRSSLVWISLLAAIEAMDILTTDIGRAHGAVESMPISAAVMNEGGMVLFIAVKLALVAAGATAVLLALLWVRSGRPGAGWVYFFTMSAIRVTTVALAIVSLHNAVLLQSLTGPA
jgi:ABC-type long-subunit fatty acid transport system fused permease/ATPase subunit